MVEVDLSGEAYTAMRRSSGPEIGSTTVRRCRAPQPVLTRYKLLEIERAMFVDGCFHCCSRWCTRMATRSPGCRDLLMCAPCTSASLMIRTTLAPQLGVKSRNKVRECVPRSAPLHLCQ